MHVLLSDRRLVGWEYGMLRSLEDEIVRQTGAQQIWIEHTPLELRSNRWFGQGTRHAHLRRFLPVHRIELPAETEVVWNILMGPEDYRLDRRAGFSENVRHRVVYQFDTLPAQMPTIRDLFSGPEWNVRVTSFDDALPMLAATTGGEWYHADQAVSLKYFAPAPPEKRVIHFSSYGRRHPRVHEALLRFCERRGLYYDYTTHGRAQPTAESLALLKQFAWHLCHSLFTVCWPVEITNPQRAGDLSPITCRWFEAAAAGAAIIGQPPRNPRFARLFGEDFVTPLDPEESVERIGARLEEIWDRRMELSTRALAPRERLGVKLDWSERVRAIRGWLSTN